MLYSKECSYAIRALTHLARHAERRCLAKEIAQEEEIPYFFLSKILKNLARAGFLRSTKGPRGGFQLARPATEITLYAIREAVDGNDDLDACAVGLAECNATAPCPLHDSFKPLRERIKAYLQSTTLAAMSEALYQKRVRIHRSRPG